MSSESGCLTVRDDFADPGRGYRWTVRLRRPGQANALDLPSLEALEDALSGAEARRAALVVLEGEGSVFSSGLDLHWLETLRAASRNDRLRAGLALGRLLDTIAALDVPVVGYAGLGAFGAGVALLAAADWVIADPRARFRLSEARLGISGGILLKTLRRTVSESYLRRWVLTAEDFTVTEAMAAGWLTELVPQDEWPGAKERFTARIAETAPAVTTAFKRALREPVPERSDGKLLADALEGPEGAEGLRAFRQKRPPRWSAHR